MKLTKAQRRKMLMGQRYGTNRRKDAGRVTKE